LGIKPIKKYIMKKLIILMMAAFIGFSLNSFSQEKPQKTTQKATTVKTVKKDTKADVKSVKTEAKTEVKAAKEADKPGAGDKIITGQKGPDGQAVYEGPKGGTYYINKNGNKTYLKADKK
jgi:colicin import membrane protein